VAEATWRCPACDTYNGVALGACDICGTARPATPAPGGKHPDRASTADAPGPAAEPKPAHTASSAPKPTPKPASTPKPKPAPKPKSPRPPGFAPVPAPTSRELLEGLIRDPAAFGGVRATPELAAVLPELFHPDGRVRREISGLDGLLPPPGSGATGRRTPPKPPARRTPAEKAPATPAPARTVPMRTVPKRKTAAERRAAAAASTGSTGSASSTGSTASAAPAAGTASRTSRAAAPPKTGARGGAPGGAPEYTTADTVIGCGCALLLLAAVVTGIVALVLNAGAVAHFFSHLGHASHASHAASPPAAPTPGGTVAPGTPCPAALTALIDADPIDGALGHTGKGATLAAVYQRHDGQEEYAFCRTSDGTLLYFGRTVGKPYEGTPAGAKAISGGYEVDYPRDGTSFRFTGGKVTAYKKDAKQWDRVIVPEPGLAAGAAPSGAP
jgi:hypothetical protein